MWRRVAAASIAVLGLAAGPANAQDTTPSGHFVTIAARVCNEYTDIFANRARNNIQESLRNLGPNTNYADGEWVGRDREDEPPQDACRPLSNWRFTLGTAIAGQVQGIWGSLSIVNTVAGYSDTNIVTQPVVTDRDDDGDLSTPIAGATVIELTKTQYNRAARSSQLWIQGGTPTSPVLSPNEYAFGALRCGGDNYNGDNVEWITFKSGSKRTYCYAYYVQPPPTSGTIVIKKTVVGQATGSRVFTFKGNISYTPDQTFQLADPATGNIPRQMTFYRAADTALRPQVWSVAELPRPPDSSPGWRLVAPPTCTSKNGTSTYTPQAANPGAGVDIRVSAGDTMTCEFKNTQDPPPPGQLQIFKQTSEGFGTFDFGIAPLAGGDAITTRAVVTEDQIGDWVEAEDNPIKLQAGSYTISEGLPPATRAGTWRQDSVICSEPTPLPPRRSRGRIGPAEFKIDSNTGVRCEFKNTFIPSGSITILKTTLGGVGTTGFVITPADEPLRPYEKSAVTTSEDVPVRATGDSTRRLPLGRYLIQELATVSEDAGDWALVSVTCGNRLRAFRQGLTEIELTREHPRVICSFRNQLTRPTPPEPSPEPPTPPGPPGPPTPVPVVPGGGPTPQPELVLTKRALRSSVRVGSIATFEITVRNTGPVAAENVAVADRPGARGQVVSARSRDADCDERTPVVCRIGTLGAGESATIRVRVRATGGPVMRNFAATGSGSTELQALNNVASARVRVRRTRGALACGGPKAHAAC